MSEGFFPTTQGFQDAGGGAGGAFDPAADQTITGEWVFEAPSGKSFGVGDVTINAGFGFNNHTLVPSQMRFDAAVNDGAGRSGGVRSLADDAGGVQSQLHAGSGTVDAAVDGVGVSTISLIGDTVVVSQAPTTNNGVTNKGYVDDTELRILKTFTVATLPSQLAGAQIFVSDATGASLTGSQCFSNGTVWIDVTTGAAVA